MAADADTPGDATVDPYDNAAAVQAARDLLALTGSSDSETALAAAKSALKLAMDATPKPAELVKAVKPAHFVKLMRPALAADEGKRLTLATLKRNLLDRKPWPVLVQKRLDGAAVELWKDGDRVGAFSGDDKNLSNSLALAPVLLALKRLSCDSLVLVGVVEAWKDARHLPLDVLMGILRSEVGAPKGTKVSATVHDALHVDGADLMGRGMADRHSAVRSLGLKAPLFVVPSAQVDDADAATKAAEHMSALPGSGGAIVKAAASVYTPGATTEDWLAWRPDAAGADTPRKGYGLDFYPACGWVESELFMQDWLTREWDLSQLDYETAMEEATEEGAKELKDDESETVTVLFVLQFHGFRQRAGAPATEGVLAKHYDLRLDFGEETLRHWVLSKSPLENDETKGWFKRDENKAAMTAEGVFEPGDPTGFNPTANTTAIVKRIDKGEAEVIVDDEDAFKARFNGKRFKGVWAFARADAGEWTVSRL